MTKTNCQREFEKWVNKDEGLTIIKNAINNNKVVSPWHEIYLKMLEVCWKAGYEAARKEGEDAKVQE